MLRYHNFFLLVIFACLPLCACFSQNIVLNSQTDVDNFSTAITEVNGNFTIQQTILSDSITDLSNLSNVTVIAGDLTIEDCTHLTNLDGFSGLTFLQDHLEISNNPMLTNIDGLLNLTFPLNRIVAIEKNDSLLNLNGLSNLSGNISRLTIKGNASLVNLDELSGVTKTNGLEISNNALLTNVDGLMNINEVVGDLIIENNPVLDNLDGFSGLNTIFQHLMIKDNPALTHLNGFDNLTSLGLTTVTFLEKGLTITNNDGLTDIAGFPNLTSFRGIINISTNNFLTQISGLNGITEITEGLFIEVNPTLMQIDGFQNVSMVQDYFSINQNAILTDINGFSNLSVVEQDFLPGFFFISQNPLLTNIDGFSNLQIIDIDCFINNNATLPNLDAFSNLTSINGELLIANNDALTNLNGLVNLESIGGDFTIQNNALLSDCCAAKNLLITPNAIVGEVNILDNPANCSSVDEVVEECGGAILSGFFYYDENENGVKDASEIGLNLQSLQASPESITHYSDNEGSYKVFAENNTYTLTPDVIEGWNLTSDSSSYTLIVTDESVDNLNFGYFPIENINEVSANLSSSATRCGFTVPFWLNYQNDGTLFASGNVIFEIDPLVSFVEATPAPDLIDGNILSWNFENLPPTHNNQIELSLEMPGVDNLGDTLHFNSIAMITDANGNTLFSDTTQYHPIVNCAYDPNDKQVFPQGIEEEQYTLFGQTLEYTVRFQNTGTDTAFTVRITDQLDENLDWTTFQPLNASHDFEVSLAENGLVTFLFEDILLPDSTTNLIGSNGYFKYKIDLLSNLPENTEIENTADIYFDFNPPIQTNTTLNTFVSELPTSIYQVENPLNIQLYPNPVTQQLQVNHLETNLQYTLFRTDGVQVANGILQQQDQLDFSDLQTGTYFLKIANKQGTVVRKILKIK